MVFPDTVKAGYIFAFLAAACWSLLGTLGRVPAGHGISAMEVAFWRALVGFLMFATHAFFTRQYRVRLVDGVILCGFGVVGVGVFFTVCQMAIERGGVALSVILLYTAPFWVVLFARFLFKERITLLRAAALAVAAAGVVLLSLSGGGLPEKHDLGGVLFGLLSGLLYSMHFLFGKVYLRRFSAITIYTYSLAAGTLAMLPLVEFSPHKTGADWAAMSGLGAFCTYAAYMNYCAGLKRLDAGKLAVLCNLEPVLATMLGMLVWGEMFAVGGWVGAALVIGAIFLILMDKQN